MSIARIAKLNLVSLAQPRLAEATNRAHHAADTAAVTEQPLQAAAAAAADAKYSLTMFVPLLTTSLNVMCK